MPSAVIHLGIAGLIAAALLSKHFDTRAVAVVWGVVLIPEIDVILGLWFDGAHRAYMHNIWIVVIPAVALWWDVRVRNRSFVRERWGDWGVRVSGVALVALLFGHILLDAFYNGVNLFWPIHDAFYDLDGELQYSTTDGFIQTFIDLSDPDASVRGTTDDTHYRTGIDPAPPGETAEERTFFLLNNGSLAILALTGFLVTAYRLAEGYYLHDRNTSKGADDEA